MKACVSRESVTSRVKYATATAVALGRMYDDDAQTLSLPKLLEYAETYSGIFSHSAFHTRKINGGMSPAMAAGMVENEPAFQLADLKPLRDEFNAMKKIWDAEFKPIRHEVFAHAGRLTQREIEELFSKTLVEKLENLTVFPLRLTNLLWDLYTNARPIRPYPVATRIPDVLAKVPGKVISNSEHEHAVKTTVEFLKSLNRSPLGVRSIRVISSQSGFCVSCNFFALPGFTTVGRQFQGDSNQGH
jgi:AbiU2